MSHPINPLILQQLAAFARRRRKLILFRGLCAALATLLLTMMAVALIDRLVVLPDGLRWGLSLAAYAVVLIVEWRSCLRLLMQNPDPRRMARMFEHAEPKLREDLLSAVELGGPGSDAAFDSEEFRGLVQTDVAHRMEGLDMETLLPMQLVRRYVGLAAVIGLACVAVFALSGWQFGTLLLRALMPGANLARVSRVQVRVVTPEAPDKVVAQGETEPLVIEISGQRVNAARLETTTLSGRDVLKMTPLGPDKFSATIQVGREDVTYRIYAGDAVTQKFHLQAVARPHVVAFEKTYTYPDYSRLPVRHVTEENGDLTGLEETKVELRLETNQRIKAASLVLDRGKKTEEIELTAEGTRLVGAVPLTASGTYRVHLVGADTGFENKFSPEYELRVEPDLAPQISLDSPAQDLILPANEIVDLAGAASDDLALAKVAQLVKVNDGPWKETVLIESPGAKYNIAQRWDLFAQGARAGDLLTTKLLAVDLKGHRTESRPLQVTIIKSGFELKRLSALEAERELLEALKTMRVAATALMKKAGEARDQFDKLPEADPQRRQVTITAQAALDEFSGPMGVAVAQLTATLKAAEAGHVSADLVQVGRLLTKIDAGSVQFAREGLGVAAAAPEAAYARDQMRELADLCAKAEGRARLAEDSFRIFLGGEETEVLGENLNVVAREMERLALLAQNTKDDPQQWAQLANRTRIVLAETRSLEGMMDVAAANSQHDRWKGPRKSLEKAREEFTKAQAPNSPAGALRGPIQNLASISNDMARKAYDFSREQIPAAVHRHAELRANIGLTSSEFRKLFEDLLNIAAKAQWPEPVRTSLAERRWTLRGQVIKQQGDLEEARTDSDTYYVNDVRLASMALAALRDRAPQSEKDKLQKEVLGMERDFRLLETGHELAEVLAGLGHLAAAERWEIASARARTSNPRDWRWLEERLKACSEDVARLQAEPAWKSVAIEAHKILSEMSRHSALRTLDAEMRDRLTPQREPASMVKDLQPLEIAVKQALDLLRNPMDETRKVLAAMAPKLNELMAQLAEKTENLEKKTTELAGQAPQKAPEEAQAEAQQALAEQQKINERVDTVRDALRADANQQDILKQEGRERARDADDALALLKDPPAKAEQALAEAVKTPAAPAKAEALAAAAKEQQKLADTLHQLADHYEKAEQGKAEETRVALRATEAQTGIKEELDQRFAQAEQLAQMADKTPEELLKQLEQALPQHPQMQHELSTIARDALDHAATRLTEASKQENRVAEQVAQVDHPAPEQSAAAAAQAAAEAAKASAQAAQKAQNSAQNAGQQAAQAANQPAVQQASQTANDAARASQNAQHAAQMAEQSAHSEQLPQAVQQAQQAAQAAGEAAKAAQQAAGEARQAQATAENAARTPGDKQAANQASAQHAGQAAEAAEQSAKAAQDAHQLARQAAQKQLAAAAAQAAKQAGQAAQTAQKTAGEAQQQAQKGGNEATAQQAQQGAEQAAKSAASAQQAQEAAAQAAQAATPQEAMQAAQKAAQHAGEAAQAAQQAAAAVRQAQGGAQRAAQAGGEKKPPNEQSAQQAGESGKSAEQAVQAAQNAQKLALQAAESAAAMAGEPASSTPPANPATGQLAQAAKQQPQIAKAADAAGEDVSRAGRHETRLQNTATGEKLASLGDAVKKTAGHQVPAAEHALAQAQKGQDAQPAVNAANSDLRGELGQLQAALGAAEAAPPAAPASPITPAAPAGAVPATPGAPPPSPSSAPAAAPPGTRSAATAAAAPAGSGPPANAAATAAASTATPPAAGAMPPGAATSAAPASAAAPATPQEQVWMARTLDALDAVLHAMPQGAAENEPGAAGQPTAGAKPPGSTPPAPPSPAGQPGQGEQAGQAAMAQAQQAMNSAAQAAAAAARASRSSSPAENPGAPIAQSDQQAVSKGGAQAQAAAKAYGALAEAKARGGDWGKLPKQVAEQLNRGKNENVAGEYRNQVETYYRVIAEKAKKP